MIGEVRLWKVFYPSFFGFPFLIVTPVLLRRRPWKHNNRDQEAVCHTPGLSVVSFISDSALGYSQNNITSFYGSLC